MWAEARAERKRLSSGPRGVREGFRRDSSKVLTVRRTHKFPAHGKSGQTNLGVQVFRMWAEACAECAHLSSGPRGVKEGFCRDLMKVLSQATLGRLCVSESDTCCYPLRNKARASSAPASRRPRQGPAASANRVSCRTGDIPYDYCSGGASAAFAQGNRCGGSLMETVGSVSG